MDISCAHDVPAELHRTEPICAGGCGRRTFDSDYALCPDCRAPQQYQIESVVGGQWVADAVGEPNLFNSPDEAETMIVRLKTLGDDWARAEYRVSPVYIDAGPVEEPTAADFLSPHWPILRDAIEADRKDPK